MNEKKQEAEAVKATVQVSKDQAEAILEVISEDKAVAEEKLKEAEPALREAEAALLVRYQTANIHIRYLLERRREFFIA